MAIVADPHTFHDTSTPSTPVSRQIVAIDDDPMTLRLLEGQLSGRGYALRTADNAHDGLRLIHDETAVALVDLRMPGIDGFECLRRIRERHGNVQVIILTASQDTADAVEAMRAGAFHYLNKPCDANHLSVFVDKAFDAWRLATETRDLRESHSHNLPVPTDPCDGDIHEAVYGQIQRIASLDSTVFIGGESGTGKSTVARLIHQSSHRARGPFVTVNCASLPRDLLTSELFGHTKGAFTGADRDRAGHAEVANGGTLFLDEIGDLPLDLQPKLLTFLQDRTIQRLGSSQTRHVDVRLIVATHCDLAEMCRLHAFRQDLFFRLMVLTIDLPPLRLRLGELPALAQRVLTRLCHRLGVPAKQLSSHAIDKLMRHNWPGNIRELENVLERATAFSTHGEIRPEDLVMPRIALEESARLSGTATGSSPEEASVLPLAGMSLDDIERLAIQQTLQACGGNKARSARLLGISEKSIYNKMRRLQIQWPVS